MKQFLLILSFICLSIIAWADPNYPVVERNGKQYYQYTIQRGDGLYAIGKKFNVTQKELYDANPNLTEKIREGDKLLIPTKRKVARSSKPQTIHIVQDKETPYAIAKMYNVPLDTLIRYNPDVRHGIIHTGDTIIVSYQKVITPNGVTANKTTDENQIPETIVVKEKETLYSISKTYNVPMSTLLDLNPSAEDGLKKGQTLRLRPGDGHTVSAQVVSPDTVAPKPISRRPVAAANALKIAYILPFTNSKSVEPNFIEFYRGSLIALDRARTDNALNRDIEVWAWDTRGKQSVLDSILMLDELKKVDVIIGPGFTSELEPVIRYARNHNKKIIVPFSSHIDKSLFFDKLYQFNPPTDYWWNIAIRREINAHPADRYLIAHTLYDNQKGPALAAKLMGILRELKKPFYQIDMTATNADSLVRANAKGNTVLLIANNSGVEVRPMIDNIAESYHGNLTLWGFAKWGNALRRFAPSICYSLFYDQADESYENQYLNLFHRRSVHSDIRFDLLGYDITTYIVNKNAQFLQSDMNFVKMDGRYLNTKIYRVHWNGYTLSAE